MKHRSLEDGRRRRLWLLAAWIAAVVLLIVVVRAAAPNLDSLASLIMTVAVMAAILAPAFWVIRRNDEAHGWYLCGRCVTCGYDLRKNDDRCPECGRRTGYLRA